MTYLDELDELEVKWSEILVAPVPVNEGQLTEFLAALETTWNNLKSERERVHCLHDTIMWTQSRVDPDAARSDQDYQKDMIGRADERMKAYCIDCVAGRICKEKEHGQS